MSVFDKILILVFFIQIFLFSQKLNSQVEIYIGVVSSDGIYGQNYNTFGLYACSAIWSRVFVNEPCFLTHEYDHPIDYQPTFKNNSMNDWSGFNFAVNPDPNLSSFGYGLYKISTGNGTTYFYLDYRDTRYGAYESFLPPSVGHDADIWIRFNESIGQFGISSSSNNPNFLPIVNGQVIRIWEIKQKGYPLTSDFLPNYTTNSFSVTCPQGKPKLEWVTFSTPQNLSGYYLYRAFDDRVANLVESEFNWIASLPPTATEFIDTTVNEMFSEDSYRILYRLIGVNGTGQSIYSDTVRLRYGSINWNVNGLVLTNNEFRKHPRLVWGRAEEFYNDLTGFEVQRKLNTQDFVTIASLNPDQLTFTDNQVTVGSNVAGTPVLYRIRANSLMENPISNVVSVNTNNQSAEKKSIITNKDEKVQNFEIENIYPNPFNNTAVISYSISKDSYVSLTITNLLGELLATLVDANQSIGKYNVRFNRTDYSSSVYFCTLTVNGRSVTKKLLQLM
ncbi:MAG: T9SS type A sorting domain-containing protein [Ignavibacteriales bacterium]|nr:T9SS type A sorting domain-containing protein [Ignavibacteriales bacterium]